MELMHANREAFSAKPKVAATCGVARHFAAEHKEQRGTRFQPNRDWEHRSPS
jgi:hypothetical protein